MWGVRGGEEGREGRGLGGLEGGGESGEWWCAGMGGGFVREEAWGREGVRGLVRRVGRGGLWGGEEGGMGEGGREVSVAPW